MPAETFILPLGDYIYSYGTQGEPEYIGCSSQFARIGSTVQGLTKDPQVTLLRYTAGYQPFPTLPAASIDELTNVEDLLVALNGWVNHGLRRNGIQSGGKNKGAWLGANCGLQKLVDFYIELTDPYDAQWKSNRDARINALLSFANSNSQILSQHPTRSQWPALYFDSVNKHLCAAYCTMNTKDPITKTCRAHLGGAQGSWPTHIWSIP